jgi:hypothetical protein
MSTSAVRKAAAKGKRRRARGHRDDTDTRRAAKTLTRFIRDFYGTDSASESPSIVPSSTPPT